MIKFIVQNYEWEKCFQEASVFEMPHQLRYVCARIPLIQHPPDQRVARLSDNPCADLSSYRDFFLLLSKNVHLSVISLVILS